MSKKIVCRVHDDNEVIIKVGIEGEGTLPVLKVWERIKYGGENFHTFENGKEAKVHARERNGTKYLTSHHDEITENNLDELNPCQI